MSLQTIFKKIRKGLWPSPYEIRLAKKRIEEVAQVVEKIEINVAHTTSRIDEIKGQLDEASANLLRIAKYQSEQLPGFIRKLTFLTDPQSAASGNAPTISRNLRHAAAQLNPTILHAGSKTIALCTILVGEEYSTLVQPCTDTKIAYCKRHGYTLLVLDKLPPGFERPISWAKLPFLLKTMDAGFEKMFFLDADAMITNPDIRLETFFEGMEEKLLFVTENTNGLNMGSLFLKNNLPARVLLDLIWSGDFYIYDRWWEQMALQDLVNRHPGIEELLKIDDGSARFNCCAVENQEACGDWKSGDFILHFASYRAEKLRALVKKYSELI